MTESRTERDFWTLAAVTIASGIVIAIAIINSPLLGWLADHEPTRVFARML